MQNSRIGWMSVLLWCWVGWAQAQSNVVGDFHVTEYADGMGGVAEMEAFTKMPDQEVFFGLTCSGMSALPMLRVLMFNDAVVSDSPKFTEIRYRLDASPGKVALNGVLKVTDTAEEYSNQVVWDAKTAEIHSLAQLKQQYQTLLDGLAAHQHLQVMIQHHHLTVPEFRFSLKGFDQILKRYRGLCL